MRHKKNFEKKNQGVTTKVSFKMFGFVTDAKAIELSYFELLQR